MYGAELHHSLSSYEFLPHVIPLAAGAHEHQEFTPCKLSRRTLCSQWLASLCPAIYLLLGSSSCRSFFTYQGGATHREHFTINPQSSVEHTDSGLTDMARYTSASTAPG